MHERFAEGWRAAGYVSSGIATDFGEHSIHRDALVEVTLHARGTVTRRVCRAHAVGKAASELCHDFPRATVYYHPDSAYGFIAQIRCHCGRENSPGCCRSQDCERATVTVVLARDLGKTAAREAGVKEGPKTDGIAGVW